MADDNITGSSTPSRFRLNVAIFLICAAFLCQFFAYNSLEQIQSSLNAEAGKGQIGLSVLYAGFIVSSFIIGKPVVQRIGPKWSMFFAFIPYPLYMASMLHVTWYTLIPASLLLGLVAGIVWVANGTYLTIIANEYANLTGEKQEKILDKVNGIFWSVFACSTLIGNALSGLILSQNTDNQQQLNTTVTADNSTFVAPCGDVIFSNNQSTDLDHGYQHSINVSCQRHTKSFSQCGMNYCPYNQEHVETLVQPERTLIIIYISILVGFSILCVILTGFLPDLRNTSEEDKSKSTCTRVLDILRMMSDVKLLLMIPVILFGAIFFSTIIGGFNQAFISCTQSVGMVGYIMMSEAACRALWSFTCGNLTKFIPRFVQMLVASGVSITITITWAMWTPSDELHVLYIWAAASAFVTAVYWTFTPAIMGQMFPDKKEGAFAHYHGWRAVGFCIAYGYGNYLCQDVKTYIMLATCIIASISYTVVEYMLRKEERTKQQGNTYKEVPVKESDATTI